MKVLYLTMNPNRQSTTVPTEGWFRVLLERGLRPILVSRELGAFHEWVADQAIPAYRDDLPFPDKRTPLRFFRSLWHLRRIVLGHRVQLIHCNEQDIYPIGQYLGRICRLPVVVSVHFTMERGFCKWAFEGKKLPQRMFFLSPGSQQACRPGVKGVVPEDRFRLLYNGLDLERFRPNVAQRRDFRQKHVNDSDVAVGVACAIRPRKQLEHLFEAASRIDDQRLKVVVAGGPVAGDEEYANQLFESARSRLGNRLVLLGHIDELRGLYNGLDMFVNTSQEEACSISVIEALACGCPVLGYASKSVDDQILPGGGEIVPQDDVGELAGALTRWISNQDELSSRRIAARKRAEDAFDIRKLSYQLWDEYCEVLDDWNRVTTKAASML